MEFPGCHSHACGDNIYSIKYIYLSIRYCLLSDAKNASRNLSTTGCYATARLAHNPLSLGCARNACLGKEQAMPERELRKTLSFDKLDANGSLLTYRIRSWRACRADRQHPDRAGGQPRLPNSGRYRLNHGLLSQYFRGKAAMK